MLRWGEECHKCAFRFGVMWASCGVFKEANSHSSCSRVKSCLWALWSAFSSFWFAVIFKLFTECWGTIVENVDNDVTILIICTLFATADMVDLNSFWKEVGCVLHHWGM